MVKLTCVLSMLPNVVSLLISLTRFAVPKSGKDLYKMEHHIYKLCARIGDQLILNALEKLHQDNNFIKEVIEKARIDSPVPLRNKGWRTVSVLLMGGTRVVLSTPYFREDHRKKRGPKRKKRGSAGSGGYPVLTALGIRDGVSPATRSEIALYTIQAASYEEAAQILKRRGIDCDISTLRRTALATGQSDISLRDSALSSAAKISIPPDGPLAHKRVRASVDGGRVRTRKSKKGRKTKKGRRRFETPWREPRILTIDVLDDNGRPRKFTLPLYDVLIDDADATFSLLVGYLRLLGAPHATELVFVADGAEWIWNRMDRLITDAQIPESILVEVVDFYHACEHLHQAVEICPKLSRKKRDKIYKQLRHSLRHNPDGVKIVMVQLWSIYRHEKMGDLLSYFLNHSCRMNYAELKEKKLPIGSGQVESAVRRVINLRFKAPGSFWNVEAAEKLMHLRAMYKSGRWEEMIQRILDQEFHLPSFEATNDNEGYYLDDSELEQDDLKKAA